MAAGVLMTSYEEPQNKRLKDFFKVLSLSLARDGLPYISTMEARKVRAACRSISLLRTIYTQVSIDNRFVKIYMLFGDS
jgi:hypothetical protein